VTRLLVFCGLFLFAATTILADETEEHESHSFGFKIEIEDGEVHVEKTGAGDLDELPAMIEGKIAEIVERISKDKNIQVRAKAIMNDGEMLLKELPLEGILESIGESIRVSGNVGADVDVEMEEIEGGNRQRVEIRQVAHGDGEEDIMKVIKGLKGKLGKDGAKTFRWTSDGGDDVKMLFVRDAEGSPQTTYRLGIHIGEPVGISVESVSEGSAAEAAGIEAGDVIVTVNGEKVGNVDTLIGMVNQSGNSGESMKIAVLRDGETVTVSATPSQIAADDEDEDEDEDEDGDEDEQHGHGDHDHHKQGHHGDAGDQKTHAGQHAEAHMKAVEQAQRRAQAQIKKQRKRIEAEVKRARAMERKAQEQARAAADLQRRGGPMQELRSELAELREMVEGLREAIEADNE
jgi:hypothetical protein